MHLVGGIIDKETRKALIAAIAAIKKERKRIAWDANCARLLETGNEHQERCLVRYREMTAQIELLESMVNPPKAGGVPHKQAPAPERLTGKDQIAFVFSDEEDR